MPIYEYICHECNGQFQKLVQGFQTPSGLQCPRCHSTNLQRAISRFATVKSEEARMESLADPSFFAGVDENDPRSIAQWAKKMGKQLGEEAGEDWDEMVEQMIDEELSGEGEGGDATGGTAAKKHDQLGWG